LAIAAALLLALLLLEWLRKAPLRRLRPTLDLALDLPLPVEVPQWREPMIESEETDLSRPERLPKRLARRPRRPSPKPPLIEPAQPASTPLQPLLRVRPLPPTPLLPLSPEARLAGLPDRPNLPAPTVPRPRRYDPGVATRLLERGVLARDVKLGIALPGAGNIAAAIARSVRMHAPAVSNARLLAHVGTDGCLSSLRVISFDGGDASAWQRAAIAAKRGIGKRCFALRAPLDRGALVTIAVTSNLELPSGKGRQRRFSRPRTFEGPRWPWAPTMAPRKNPRNELPTSPPPDELRTVGADPESTLPPCDPGDILCPGCRFDVADIGARASRIVRTKVSIRPAQQSLSGPLR